MSEPHHPDSPAILAEPAPQIARSSRPTRVLIVEDEPVTAEVFERCLRQAGHETSVARDGIQALRLLRERPPDLVILDLGLPNLPGVEVVRRLRHDLGPQTPILIVSGTPRAHVNLHTDDLLPGLWLCKPIRPRELIAAVERVLGHRDGPANGVA